MRCPNTRLPGPLFRRKCVAAFCATACYRCRRSSAASSSRPASIGWLAGGGDKTVTLYLAIFDNVLHRLRFSKFLSVVRVDIPEFMEGSLSANDGHHAVAGNKRKHEALQVDEEDSIIAESEVLWRINFERFIFCLKKKFCAERKKAKMRLGTLAILEAFFEANVTNNDNKTVTSPIDGILERVGQKEGGTSMTLDQIISVLNDLECTSTTNNPEEFTFDLNKLVETCRNDEIESLVKKKHGQEAYTIFRLLLKQGCPVETDEITDRTILDKQVVHETLQTLEG
ncbi:unnamed protein product [Miscanthus lutarioriparius]|uniref:DNA-directed RNA polymerase III subunit RPC3 n=1 Tax=Miscanthus lutarioriparius TaxID=422564 RepID=A0A811NYM8_9POAL|nr:unnamed protein product [Miscanthus lutarioriparius]